MMDSRKTVLITGGLNGIGLEISRACLQSKLYNICVADIAIPQEGPLPIDPFQSIEESQGRYLLLHCDVSKEDHVQQVVSKTVETFSRLDAVINNAAISHPHYGAKDITGLSLEEWNRTVSINLTSIFLTTKYAVPHLKQSKGCIINVSSTRALQSEANTEIYSATKGAVLSLTHSLSISLGPEINVNAISPGWIDVQDHQLGKEREYNLRDLDHRQHPVGRVGRVSIISQ